MYMANKPTHQFYSRKALFMGAFLFYVLASFWPTILLSQKFERCVRISNIDGGMLYFIKPIKIKYSNLLIHYDVTISAVDSNCYRKCDIRASIVSKKKLLSLEKTIFEYCGEDYTFTRQNLLFYTPIKRKFHYRIEFSIKYSCLQQILHEGTPILLKNNTSDEVIRITLQFPKSVTQLPEIINLNANCHPK